MVNQTGKKKLFLSLRATLEALRLGLVTDDDLNNGLFQFNFWNRDLLKDPEFSDENPVVERIFRRWEGARVDSLTRVIRALRQAEQEGRVSWVGKDDHSIALLNQLLEKNGYGPLERLNEDQRFHILVPRLNVVNHDWLVKAVEENRREVHSVLSD